MNGIHEGAPRDIPIATTLIKQPPEQREGVLSGNGHHPTQDRILIPTHVFGRGQRLKRDGRITILDFENEIKHPCAKGFVRISRPTTYLKNVLSK